MKDDKILLKNEVFAVIGAAIDVHKEMGPGFLESVYEECMCIEATDRLIPYKTQVRLPVKYKGQTLSKEYVADFIAYGKVVVEFKCITRLSKADEAQILNYLKATGLEVGLLINFGSTEKLEWKRFVLQKRR